MWIKDSPHRQGTWTPNAKMKGYIIVAGSCRPPGPFPRDKNQENRCFSDKYCTTITKAGVKLPREWLCYSPTLDCAYCEPCWLFADRNVPFYNEAWVKGVWDWQHLSHKIDLHAQSQIHIGAIYNRWKKNGRIDEILEWDARNATNYWRQILERIVNATITLATCNLSWRNKWSPLELPKQFLKNYLMVGFSEILKSCYSNRNNTNNSYASPVWCPTKDKGCTVFFYSNGHHTGPI